jgi:hypothetical protein
MRHSKFPMFGNTDGEAIMINLDKEFFDVQNADRFQNNYLRNMTMLSRIPYLNGQFLNNGEITALTTSFQNFEHRLGRKAQGYIVMYQDASSSVFAENLGDENFIRLRGSANVNAKIWVF